ncbi:MAG: hypothetical protein OXT09_14745 [Myxococcales bacterium]|nr:hypothetical protein [Myxococcales bacterium]
MAKTKDTMREQLQERLSETRHPGGDALPHAAGHRNIARNLQHQRREVVKVYAPEGRFTLPYASLGKTLLHADGETLELDFLAAVVTIKGHGLAVLDDRINDHVAAEVRTVPRSDFQLEDDQPIVVSIAVKQR